MSDLPDGVPDSIFHRKSDGTKVELLGYRRKPNLDFILDNKPGRIKRKSLPGSVRSHRSRLIDRDGLDCHYCEKTMALPHQGQSGERIPYDPRMATIEHVVARVHGGPNAMDNLVLACAKCNNQFGDQKVKCRCEFCAVALFKYGARIR